MNKETTLNRTCLSCGQQKPLAAFLQISGTHGTMYGNVCASCRGSVVKKVTLPTSEEDDSGSKSKGVKIDTKAKIQAEIERKKQAKKLEEDYKKELELKDKKAQTIEKKKIFISDAERLHREEFIEKKKKTGFLISDKTDQRRDSFDKKQTIDSSILSEKQALSASDQREFDRQMEYKITTIDLAVPFLDPQFASLLVQSPVFQQFRKWLGTNAPIMRTLEQLYNQNANMLNKVNHGNQEPRPENNDLADLAHKTFGPSRKP